MPVLQRELARARGARGVARAGSLSPLIEVEVVGGWRGLHMLQLQDSTRGSGFAAVIEHCHAPLEAGRNHDSLRGAEGWLQRP